MLVTSRPLDEYCGFFGLTRAALRSLPGPVLDCPGGAAALAAEARALGCEVVAADPLYALPPSDLLALARTGRDVMAEAMRTSPRLYPARPQLRPEKYLRSWDRARALFAADRTAHPERYVAAALPQLPFADGVFALTLSSYLLFAHPEHFTAEGRLDALLELVRVTDPAGEVRVHPLHDGAGRRCPQLDALRAELGRHGVASEIEVHRAAGRPRRILRLRAVRSRAGLRRP